jgi:hypothetical protein
LSKRNVKIYNELTVNCVNPALFGKLSEQVEQVEQVEQAEQVEQERKEN